MYQPAHAAHQQHIQPKNAKQQRHNAHFEVGDFQQNNEWQYDEPFAALAVMAWTPIFALINYEKIKLFCKRIYYINIECFE